MTNRWLTENEDENDVFRDAVWALMKLTDNNRVAAVGAVMLMAGVHELDESDRRTVSGSMEFGRRAFSILGKKYEPLGVLFGYFYGASAVIVSYDDEYQQEGSDRTMAS